jgi:aminoglycoside/choline kinase family phosphotransferase
MTVKPESLAFVMNGLGLSGIEGLIVSPLGKRGSDRLYYRLEWQGKRNAILVEYDPRRRENCYFADIAVFLDQIGVPVPKIIRHDPEAHLILMEDLGDKDLWSLRGQPWESRGKLYRNTLAVVNRLHSARPEEFEARGVRLMEPFGPRLYRWERDYFLEHFVSTLCGIRLSSGVLADLEQELSALAERLGGSPARLIHRDLQSQNIMICGNRPVLIDFQGMRYGNIFYDLGSLLCDPYVGFSEAERDELLAYYYGLTGKDVSLREFRRLFWDASVQRLMQALGAYGFLGKGKGLSDYLCHVPAALQNLLIATEHAGSLPLLKEICSDCGIAVTGNDRLL